MIFNADFIKDFMQHYPYPTEAFELLELVKNRFAQEPDFAEKFDAILKEYLFPAAEELGAALDKVTKLAEEKEINEYSLHFIFLLSCVETIKARYAENGIDEQIYWDTMADLFYKYRECEDCEEVPGIFVAHWYSGFFDLTRFAHGRFQYEIREFNLEKDFVTSSGKVIKSGDKYINFHIPSSGVSLTDDVRLDSYKKAYEVYKHLFDDGIVIFGCGSWLLYPRHREFLPSHLNILKFMDDFEMISSEEQDEFSNGWRVFGKYSDLPLEQLPKNNSLQKAYADWLVAGNKAGSGFGLILFDGEKILK